MKEAIGNSAITIIIITFMGILILILASSSSYSKASKVRNRIIEMIENNQGYGPDCKACINPWDDFRENLDSELSNYGYRINSSNDNCRECPKGMSNEECNSSDVKLIDTFSKYQYCVYEIHTVKGVYYGVETYMYFDIPLVDNVKFGIYGETKTLYDLSEF